MTDKQLRIEIERVLYDFCHAEKYSLVKAIKDLIFIAQNYKIGKTK
jgi:hypothetical protein